jgi:hypothetical protein
MRKNKIETLQDNHEKLAVMFAHFLTAAQKQAVILEGVTAAVSVLIDKNILTDAEISNRVKNMREVFDASQRDSESMPDSEATH